MRAAAPHDPGGAGGRFAIYVGTGGPGHIDPHQNDGRAEGAQGLARTRPGSPGSSRCSTGSATPDTALIAVCHSFGVMCRWSDVAMPMLASRGKGGKSAGILENVLTDEACSILVPAARGRAAGRIGGCASSTTASTTSSRLRGRSRRALIAIGHETRGCGGPAGEALTMVEWARDRAACMPRIFAVNHHPEIVDRSRQMLVLHQKLDRGEVTREWFDDRARVLTETYPDDAADLRLHLTSDFTLMGPLRYQIYRQVRLRAAALGVTLPLHEDELPLSPAGAAGRVPGGHAPTRK